MINPPYIDVINIIMQTEKESNDEKIEIFVNQPFTTQKAGTSRLFV